MTGNAVPLGPDSVPIAKLEPSLIESGRPVHGVVTLIWPYSTSNQSFSILLAEPDFRLRRQKGQVRVHFTGSSAKAVSRCNPQSGDHITLNLVGAQWEKDKTASKTPGKGIDWQLRFGERATLKIQRENLEAIPLDIDHPVPSPEPQRRSPPPSDTSEALPFPSTPILSSTAPLRPQTWSTPAFLKRDRLSSTTFFGSDYDPFDEHDFRDNNRRKKTRFGRGSDQWRFTERSTSPESSPGTETPVVEPTAAKEGLDALVNGHERPTESQDLNKAHVDGHLVSAEALVANPQVSNDSVMLVDGPTTPQPPPTADFEQSDAFPIISEGSENARPITVDEGVQTLRSGSEPLEEPHAVEQPASSKEAVEDVSVSMATYTNPALQDTQIADKQDVVGSRSSPGSRTGDATMPNIPPGGEHESVRLESQVVKIPLLEQETTQGDVAEKEASSPLVVSQSLGTLSNGSQTRDKSSTPLHGGADHEKEQAEERALEHEFQEWRGAEASLQSSTSSNVPGAEVRTEEIEMAQSDPREPERTTDVADQVDSGRYRELTDSRPSASPTSDQIVPTAEESRTIDSPLPGEDRNSYHDDQASTKMSEPISLPLDGLRARGDEGTLTAATRLENTVNQNEKTRHVLTSDSESEVEEQEPEAHPEFFSDDEDQQWDPEEEEIIEEEERQRVVEESKSPDEGWNYEGWDSEEEEFLAEDAPGSWDSLDDEEGEEVSEVQQMTPITRNSPVVIDLIDSDEEEDVMAQSQIDGAAISVLRRQSLFASVGLPSNQEGKLHRSSPPPLPDTVPDSQPVSDVVEREMSTEDIVLQANDVGSSSTYPDYDEVSKEQHLRELDIHAKEQDGHTESWSASPTRELVNEEHIDPRLKNRVLTPNDTQKRDELSQASAVTLHSIEEAHKLPTPQLTQNRSSDILLPASLRPSSPVIPSSSPPASQADASPPLLKEDPSSLVDALREIGDRYRILPKQLRKSHRVSNIPASVSPWFAPRRSSEAVPKSRSESEATSEDDDESENEEEAEAAEAGDQPDEDRDEEIPSSMPEAPAEPLNSKHTVQPSSTPGPKPAPSPPTGLRTSHDYYAPLSTLPSHFNTQTSTLSIVLAATPVARASSGPRDFYTTVILTDPSSLPSTPQTESNPPTSPATATAPFTTTTVFRPARSSLPSPLPSGSVLLLRSFTVTHSARTPSLLSSDSSAWAVFPPHTPDPAISGPPVEFGAEERGYVRGLWEWWDQVDASVKADVVGQADDRVRKAVAREEREKRKGRRLKGMGLRLAPGAERGKGKGWEVRHELRDGKEWVDHRMKKGG
ncbi:MAG: hypothetical protein LQ344_006670 [Seirophora lacunosa]|nr:MAG: hypothetical protein LQ344_006670 [Seirophora lacunosa]